MHWIRRTTVAVLAAGATLVMAPVMPCTMIALGKHATQDGSTIVAHTDDAGGDTGDLRLVRVPARNYSLPQSRPVYRLSGGYPRVVAPHRSDAYEPQPGEELSKPLGLIDQVASTYGYLEQDYGIMNDVQLSIAESTCNGKTFGWSSDLPYGHNLFSIGELTRLALERCDSARCAIQLMGDLAVKHGFYGDYSGTPETPGHGSSEALGITDKFGDVWVFHLLTGPGNASAVWAAQRLEHDHVTIVPNEFVIEAIDLKDADRFLAAPNVFSFAQEMGWWDPLDEPFSFKKAYGYEPPSVGPRLFLDGRKWRVFDRFAPSLQLSPSLGYVDEKPSLPFSVRVDSRVGVQAVMDMLRDHYEGTPYDLTKGLAAGPFGNPVRYSGFVPGLHGGWARAISLHRTLFSFVLQSRGDLPDAIGGITWYGQSAPHGTVYVPFSGAQQSLPLSYQEGKQSEFSFASAWWPFDFVNNWRSLRYDAISEDVQVEITRLQREALQRQELFRQQFETIGSLDIATLEKDNNAFADRVVVDWWRLAWRLVAKYSDGYVTTGEHEGGMQSPGYPAAWVEHTEFSAWPTISTIQNTSWNRLGELPRNLTVRVEPVSAESSTMLMTAGSVGVGILIGVVGTVLVVHIEGIWRRRATYERI